MTTSTVDAEAAKRTRRTTKAATEAPSTGEAASVTRTSRPRTRRGNPVTVTKVALGVGDLARSLYWDAVARVGGERNLYRVRVLSPSRYEVDMTGS